MNDVRPDYFAALPSVEDGVIRGIKGNFRRKMVFEALLQGDLTSIPKAWRSHSIPEELKSALTTTGGPQARGGEDLPDLEQGEVEIARLSLIGSVHGEVTSLRAKRDSRSSTILLTMVDEYGTAFRLSQTKFSSPLTAQQVLATFRDADPTPTEASCQSEYSSFFYPDLNSLGADMGLRGETE